MNNNHKNNCFAEDDSMAQKVFAVSWNVYPAYLREDNAFVREKRVIAELERLFASLQVFVNRIRNCYYRIYSFVVFLTYAVLFHQDPFIQGTKYDREGNLKTLICLALLVGNFFSKYIPAGILIS
jgi:hypothetical protein